MPFQEGRRRGSIAGLAIVTAAMLVVPSTASATPSGEFLNPSWTELPAPSIYNRTPACPVSASHRRCEVPESQWPPPDPGSLEWGERTKNPDGSWDTFRTGYINSAYWPAEKRPDIETYGIERFGYEYEKPEGCSSKLPHYCFLTAAEKLGYPIDHQPEVGALWLTTGECLASSFVEYLPDGTPSGAPCTNDDEWFIGYVEQVLPDGAFVISWGGSATEADSGLELVYESAGLAPVSDFIHLLPLGSPRPGVPYEDGGSTGPHHQSLSPNLRLTAGAIRGNLRIRATVDPNARGVVVVHLHEGRKSRLLNLHEHGASRTASLSPGPGRYSIVARFQPTPKSDWRSQKVRRIVRVHPRTIVRPAK